MRIAGSLALLPLLLGAGCIAPFFTASYLDRNPVDSHPWTRVEAVRDDGRGYALLDLHCDGDRTLREVFVYVGRDADSATLPLIDLDRPVVPLPADGPWIGYRLGSCAQGAGLYVVEDGALRALPLPREPDHREIGFLDHLVAWSLFPLGLVLDVGVVVFGGQVLWWGTGADGYDPTWGRLFDVLGEDDERAERRWRRGQEPSGGEGE